MHSGGSEKRGEMLCHFSIMHPLIDACSVSVLVAGGMTWERVLIYNFLAFAMQLPFGMMMVLKLVRNL